MRIRRNFLFHLMSAALCWGCASGATVPSPLAEIPSAIQYPESVSISVDTVTSAPSLGSQLKQIVGAGGEFSDEIAFGPDLANATQGLVDAALQPLSTLVIPVSPATHNFTATVEVSPFPGTGPPVNVLIQIDFSPFDLDGDGVEEPCQGHTAALPICYRIWFNGQPSMAGLFDTFPDANRNGAGRFRQKLTISSEDDGVARDIYLGVTYDQSDPLTRMAEFFERFVLAGEPVENKDPDSFDSHVALSQDGPEESAVKLLQFSGNDFPLDFPQVKGKPNDLTYVGRWQEGEDFWSGTIVAHNIDVRNIESQCALISTGEGANASHCNALSLGVGNVPPIPFLNVEDVRFPDFPASPGF